MTPQQWHTSRFDPTQKPEVGSVELDLDHPRSAGLAGLWSFQEGAGRSLMDLATGRRLLSTAAPQWRGGSAGPACNFNGTSQYFAAGNANDYSYSRGFSVTSRFWIANTRPTSYPGIIAKSTINGGSSLGWVVGLQSSGAAFGITRGFLAAILYSPALTVERWHTGTVTIGTEATAVVRIIVDGVLVASGTTTEGLAASLKVLCIGAEDAGATGFWAGQIEYVALHAREMMPDEAKAYHVSLYENFKPVVRRAYSIPGGGGLLLRRRRMLAA